MVEVDLDQAAGLRRLHSRPPLKVIAVTGGKGGVGKSNVSANLATSLVQQGRRVLLLDGDFGLANLDVLLGLRARRNLEHVISGQCELEDVVVTSAAGVRLVPGSSGNATMASLTDRQHAGLIHAFSQLVDPTDVLVVDTAAGVGPSVVTLANACQFVVIVVCDEPAAITDAYGLIKSLGARRPDTNFQILANRVQNAPEGRALFDKLLRVTSRFLNVRLNYFGHIPEDPYLQRSVKLQTPVVQAFPGSPAALALKKLSVAADTWRTRNVAGGDLEFFLERLVGVGGQSQDDLLQ